MTTSSLQRGNIEFLILLIFFPLWEKKINKTLLPLVRLGNISIIVEILIFNIRRYNVIKFCKRNSHFDYLL